MEEPFQKHDIRITVVGGGTGSFALLSALKQHTKQIAAIVNMSDDGGSTGVLRDELGTLPTGDARQCLVALSDSPKIRGLFNYRFDEGTLTGHAFGNLFLTALEKMSGSFSEAVEMASEILRIRGKVIPATLDNVRLNMEWPDTNLVLKGESTISTDIFKHDPKKAILSLSPHAKANPLAIAAIKQADIVVIAPGDLYSSLGALMVVDGIGEALHETEAICVYVSNLVTKRGQTENFAVSDHAAELERFAGVEFLDYVLYNEQRPDRAVAGRYKKENAYLVKIDKKNLDKAHYKAIAGDFLGKMARPKKGDTLVLDRSLIRHNGEAVAQRIVKLCSGLKT